MQHWIGQLEIKAVGPLQLVKELSGGNQQKVALARVLHQGADVLLLDEPTRGIDVGTKAEIYRRIGELAAAGKSVIFVSSYLPELLAVCDRVGVMSRGPSARRSAGPIVDRRGRHGLRDRRGRSMSAPTPTTENRLPAPASARRRLASLVGALGPLLVLLVVIGMFGEADHVMNGKDVFFTHQNARTIAVQASPVIVAALGMTVIIIAGGIDLAAGTALALSATVLAWFLNKGYSPLVSVSAAIGTGCLTGFINGVLVSTLRVVPFIVTLGTMTIYLGTAKYIANETTIRPPLADIPHAFESMVTPRPDPAWLVESLHLPNFAWGVWLALALAALLATVLRYTVFGRYVFALGSNEQTARLCGINVPLVKIAVYTLGGCSSALPERINSPGCRAGTRCPGLAWS